ncbi:MAG: cation transporter [Chlorobi bacterium]|nr:cation transporter [Chlorobiota bacterium]
MSAHHQHNHSSNISEKNLLIATILNFLIAFAEIAGGLISNSLSLISDSLHNLSDAIAILVAYIAHRIGKKNSNTRKTFGYKRFEIIVALFNAAVLIVISFFLFYEAVLRFLEPEPIKGKLMLTVAIIGFIANLFSVLLLKKDSKKNLNMKAAYLHLLGDTLSSVAVIVGGILIIKFNLYWVDPLITVLIGLYILKESYSILKQAGNILMQSAPENLNLEEIQTEVEELPDIANMHHVHAWNLTDKSIHFECHIDLKKDLKLSEVQLIRSKIEGILRDNYSINHLTIQFEYDCCGNKELIKNNKNC